MDSRIRGRRGETYEQRFARYTHNATVSAQYADRNSKTTAHSADRAVSAAKYCESQQDARGAELYSELADCLKDAAEAYRDAVEAAQAVAEYFERRSAELCPGRGQCQSWQFLPRTLR